jgi:small subunit ribosomal protein S16
VAGDALSRSLAWAHPGHTAGPHLARRRPAAELPWEKTTAVAVKIKLKRMGKIRAPYYRIIIADARTRRDGRAIEEIGKYHPKVDPSFIEVNSERAQYWLSVGAQPTGPVQKLLEITGDWQKFKGLPGAEGTLKTASSGPAKKDVFAAALAETLKDKAKAGDAKQERGRGRKGAAAADGDAEAPAKGTDAGKGDGPAKGEGSGKGDRARSGGKQGGGARQAKAGGGKPASAKDSPAKEGAAKDGAAKESPAKESAAKDAAAKESPAKDGAAKDAAAKESPAKDGGAKDAAAKESPAKDGGAKDGGAGSESEPAGAQAATEQGGEG